MNRPEVSIKQTRLALGPLSVLLFVQTAFWLLYDVADRGLPITWSAWTDGPVSGLSATTALDLGLAALQLGAVCGLLLRVPGAGGLLVTACAATVVFRAPVVWYMLLDSGSDPWFGGLEGPSLTAVGVSCALAILVAVAQGGLLFRVRGLEREAAAEEESRSGGIRPVKVTASASCALLAVLNVFYICRNVLTAVRVGPHALADLLVGRGVGQAVLGVSSPWQWACLTVLCGVGMVLAARRRPSATGFSVGLALFMMPIAFTKLWGLARTASLLASPLNTVQSILELAGSAAVVALIVVDVRRDRPAPTALERIPPSTAADPEAQRADVATSDA
ncbi:hypothetical protein [Streptomyces sp. NRRL S-813]|uniref:hypothetical protein n=1 Tax=Streptomyces sp. NRRL S-813 TaxID=1463919 RepID=UPI0004BF3339|nr:hypothetical protein [Streptomyces sp. NRRL S-813]